MRKFFASLVCLVLISISFTAFAHHKSWHSSSSFSTISLSPRAWNVNYYSGNCTTTLTANSGSAGWWFPFRNCDGVHYVETRWSGDLTGKTSITFTVQTVPTSGSPVYRWDTNPDNTCNSPAHARLVIENNKLSDWGFWSNPQAYNLNDQTVQTITVPLQPHYWSSTFGKMGDDPSMGDAFANMLKTHDHIGLSFGGGCFFGHGVFVTGGTANFILSNFQVN